MGRKSNWNKFVEQYKPIKNTVTLNAPFDETMFETFGADREFLQTCNPQCIWTLVSEGKNDTIVSGSFWANRIGYFVTEIPFEGERGHIDFKVH